MMYLADGCPNAVFDIATTSGFYAQMTGLLAGFAFTAIVVLLTSTQVGRLAGAGEKNVIVLVLLAALVSLIITTLTYSVLAGEGAARGRAAAEELSDGLPFGLAVIMLFHGITLLMQSNHLDRKVIWTSRTMTAIVVPVLNLYYLANGATDNVSVRLASTGVDCSTSGLLHIGVVLTVILAVVTTLAMIPGLLPPSWRIWSWARAHQHLVPIAALVMSIGSAVVAGTLSEEPADFLLPRAAITVFLRTAFGVLAVLSLMLAFGYRADDVHALEATTGPPPDDQAPPPLRGPVATVVSKKTRVLGRGPVTTIGDLRSRRGSYLIGQYLSLHITVMGVTLGIAGVTAVSLMTNRHLHHYYPVFWIMWAVSLLSAIVVYGAAMVGAISLPARIPSMSDLVIPLLQGISEFILFSFLASQLTGSYPIRVVVAFWFFGVAAFGLLAVVGIIRIRHVLRSEGYEAGVAADAIDQYRLRLMTDVASAGIFAAVGVGGGTVQLLLPHASVTAAYAFAGVAMAILIAAAISHGSTAAFWRQALSEQAADPTAPLTTAL